MCSSQFNPYPEEWRHRSITTDAELFLTKCLTLDGTEMEGNQREKGTKDAVASNPLCLSSPAEDVKVHLLSQHHVFGIKAQPHSIPAGPEGF